MKNINWDELVELVGEETRPQALPLFERWLGRGDGVAVYENRALDSGQLGHRQFTSFGSPEAQLEGEEPPQRLPDIGGRINWAYRLRAIHRRTMQEEA